MEKNEAIGEIIALAISNRLDVTNYIIEKQLEVSGILKELLKLELLSEERYMKFNLLLAG